MAAENYIKVSSTTFRGNQVLSVHDELLNLMNSLNELDNAFAESVSDDGTYAQLAVIIGTSGANANADAQAIHDLFGTLNTVLTGNSTALQVRDRISRNY